MYSVLYGNIHLHLPYSTDCLSEIDITGNLNECSTLTFEIPESHSRYEMIQNRAHEQVRVLDGETLLFCGFVYEIERDIYNTLTVTCKSDLKYLDDTIIRPYCTNASSSDWQKGMIVAPSDPESLFRWYIEQHNAHCMSAKHFEIGTNEGWRFDANNYIYRASSVTPTTLSEISEKLIDSLGGFLFVRYSENGTRYIDWLENCESVSTNLIDFGLNITDFVRTDTTDGLYTAIRPEGRTQSTSETTSEDAQYINPTIERDKEGNPSGIADGEIETDYFKQGDVIYCQSAVDAYGYIENACSFEDCETPSGLLSAGLKKLKTLIAPSTSIDIGAYDLRTLGVKDPLQVGTLVRVRSKPNGIDEYMLVSGCTLDLVNPEQTSYTLGVVDNSLVQTLNASINKSTDDAVSLRDEMDKTGQKATDAKTAADTAEQKATDAKTEADKLVQRADAGDFDGQSMAINGISQLKNGQGSATLTIKIFTGSNVIENKAALVAKYGSETEIKWFEKKRGSSDYTEVDTERISDDGFSLSVTSDDVDGWTFYQAALYVEQRRRLLTGHTMTDPQDGYSVVLSSDNLIFPATSKGALAQTQTVTWSAFCGSDDITDGGSQIYNFQYPSALMSATYDQNTHTITITPKETLTEDVTLSVTFMIDYTGPEVWIEKTITCTLARDGEDGRGVVSSTSMFALDTQSETAPTSWLAEVPTMTPEEKYLWTYDETQYSDDTKETTEPRIIGVYGETGAQGETGETGVGVSDVLQQYYKSTSATEPTGGEWSDTQPDFSTGEYIWERQVITWTDGTQTQTTPILSQIAQKSAQALDSADTAITNAATAQNTADTAITNAASAQNAADTAQNAAKSAANKTHYATCSTTKTTVAKVATLSPTTDTLTLAVGVCVYVKFTYENTASNPTLNVASTGAKPIYTNGGKYAYWSAGQTVLFTYDGSNWRVASEPVYASTVTVGNSAASNVYINSSSVNLRNSTTNLATFTSSSATIGKTDENNVCINTSSVSLNNGSTPLAKFTSTDATIGQTSSMNAYIDSNGFNVRNGTTSYLTMGKTNANAATIKSKDSTPLALSVGAWARGADSTWTSSRREGLLSEWITATSYAGNWEIKRYINESSSSYFWCELTYSGTADSGVTIPTANFPASYRLNTSRPYHASATPKQQGTTSSYAGYVNANAAGVNFYLSNTAGTSPTGTTPFTVHVCGYFTIS